MHRHHISGYSSAPGPRALDKPSQRLFFDDAKWALASPLIAVAQAINERNAVSRPEKQFDRGNGSVEPTDDRYVRTSITRKAASRRVIERAIMNGRQF